MLRYVVPSSRVGYSVSRCSEASSRPASTAPRNASHTSSAVARRSQLGRIHDASPLRDEPTETAERSSNCPGAVRVTRRSPLLVGRRVVGEIKLPCLTCDVCARGGAARRSHCLQRRCLGIWQHGGAFAERLALPAANLLAVPDDVPLRAAVFSEPLAAACRVLEQAAALGLDLSARRSSAVAVLGDGRLGLMLAAVLCAQGAQAVTLVGRHPDKLARAARYAPASAACSRATPRRCTAILTSWSR
jgi:threonine dehydrogenase-like Zn-dependent dehydrogenase